MTGRNTNGSAFFAKSLLMSFFVAATIIFSCSVGALAADLGLIDAATLKNSSSKWIVLDARPKAEWEAGHIPGARSFLWDNYTRTDEKGVQYSSFPPPELAAALAGLGIDEKTPVVVYGDADKSWGGEGYDAWLTHHLAGLPEARNYKGSWAAWQKRAGQ